MKRPKRIDKYDYIEKEFPVFKWLTCFVCENEFRREYGWRFKGFPFYGDKIQGRGPIVHACRECCPDKETVHEKYRDINSEHEKKLSIRLKHSKPPKEL